MAITDFATLKAKIQADCSRTDTYFGNQVEDFISLAEDRIFNGVGDLNDPLYSEPLRSDEMVTRSTIAFTDGEGTIPADSVGVRSLSRESDRIGLEPLSVDGTLSKAIQSARLPEVTPATCVFFTMRGHPVSRRVIQQTWC